MNQLKILYRFDVLLLFVLLEVVLFDASSRLQTVVSILEYLFLLIVFLKNVSVGILYFFSFMLLTVGWGNYFDMDLPSNFWGIRLGGFSFNIFFSIFLFAFCLIRRKGRICLCSSNITYLFMLLFILYSIVVGALNVLLGVNYIDNYFSDLMTYFPFLIYAILLLEVDNTMLLRLLKYVVVLSVFSLVFSFIFDKKAVYSESLFLLSNAIHLVLPVLVILTMSLYSKIQWIILIVITYTFIASGQYFISGKVIILYFFFFFWLCLYHKKMKYFFLFPLLLSLINIQFILGFFVDFFSGNAIAYKFSQILDVILTIDLYSLAALPSSIGNLIAEGITIAHFYIDHWYYLLFGGGFGSGVPDVFGFLTPWAGASGYSEIDVGRNNFFKMHLPIYEIMLKGGFVFLIPYLLIGIKAIVSKNIYLFAFGLLFMLTFYVNKEALLFTFVLLKLSVSERNVNFT